MLFTVLADRPAVRINQLGYLPDGPKRATWVTDGAVPVEFIIEAADGSVVLRGRSQPWPNRPEPTSGLAVHVLDFSSSVSRRTSVGSSSVTRPATRSASLADCTTTWDAMHCGCSIC